MKQYVFVEVELNGKTWGAMMKWTKKPYYKRLFSKIKYEFKFFSMCNKVEEHKKLYNKYYKEIELNY